MMQAPTLASLPYCPEMVCCSRLRNLHTYVTVTFLLAVTLLTF